MDALISSFWRTELTCSSVLIWYSSPFSSLFAFRIGYVRVAYVAAFKEVELEFLIREDQDWPQKICIVRDNLGKGGGVSMVPYRDEEGGKEGA